MWCDLTEGRRFLLSSPQTFSSHCWLRIMLHILYTHYVHIRTYKGIIKQNRSVSPKYGVILPRQVMPSPIPI